MRFYFLLLAIGTAIGGYFYGVEITDTKWQADTQTAINAAVRDALTKERALQDEADKSAQRQADELHSVNERLTAELDSLQHRPDRRPVSGDTGTNCKGSSGSDLSKRDSAFLARQAARADKYAFALIACYDYADSLQP